MHIIEQLNNLKEVLKSAGFKDKTNYGNEPSGKPVVLQKEDITVNIDFTTLTVETVLNKK